VAIAADGHGAPAATVRARVVIEEEAASGIGATTHRGARAFDEELGSGTRNSGEKPFEAALAGDEFQAPAFSVGNEFVVALGEAKQIVDGLDPDFWEGFLLDERRENSAEGLAQTKDFEEHGINSLRLGVEKGMKASGAFGRDNASVDEERDELVPGEVVRGGRSIGEIQGQATGDEVRWMGGECEGHGKRVQCEPAGNWFRLRDRLYHGQL